MSKAAGIRTGSETPPASPRRHTAKVVSLDEARRTLRSTRPERPRRPRRPQPDPIDLLDDTLNRLTPEARQVYRERVDRYARNLIKRASGLSEVESNKAGAKIAFKHVKMATRMTSNRAKTGGFGLTFASDAALTLGAAVIGALCARPDLLDGGGYAVLATAVALTVVAFVVREVQQTA